MSCGAQTVVAVVWIVVLLVFVVDAQAYVHSRPWFPQAVPYDFGVGAAATVVTVVADRFLQHRRR
jgi:hypothetical protein